MGHLGKKIKAAKQIAKDKDDDRTTEWSGTKGGKQGRCPGCGRDFNKMTAGQLRGHGKFFESGRQTDCPNV